MANISLRSPQYKTINTSNTNILSVVLAIYIDSVLKYTLAKNTNGGTFTRFEISELCRDFINIEYKNIGFNTINIYTTLQGKDDFNGTGGDIGTLVTFTDVGYESYGAYTDGANPINPPNRVLTAGVWLLASDSTAYDENNYEIFVPENETGVVLGLDSTGAEVSSSYGATSTLVVNLAISDSITITRLPCSKYGNGTKIVFINKYGVQQDLWFALKNVQNLGRKNETFKSNTLNNNILSDYEIDNAPVKIFNTNGKKTYTLSSGYYPEWAVEYFEQLLLSEYVWMKIPLRQDPDTIQTVPVVVKSSSIQLKTKLNDRLIEYTIEFEDAFDYINNIR
tara:strand:- start:1422 stop:2432 length:1011 start_codon:yes stop_codon:yes gene_type:complete